MSFKMCFNRKLWQGLNKTILILVIVNLVSKLALLSWNGAEYTDSVFYLTMGKIGKSKWMPVYPVLVQFTHLFVRDLTCSGRLTSIIMSTLSILPFFALFGQFYGKEGAIYATALYIVSPVVTRWSIRVMTESSFIFFLLLSLWCFVKWLDTERSLYGIGVAGFSGIGALTRPEGLGLLPITLAFALYALYRKKLRAVYWLVIGLLPWLFQIFWHWKVVGRYGYGDELRGGMKDVTISKFFSYLSLYLAYLPYIVTPVVFSFAAYGIYRSVRSRNENNSRKIYLVLALYMLVVWLLSLSFHWAWTTRFMFPLVALSLIFSGYGISCIKNRSCKIAAFVICIVTSAAFTAIVLICSRATFGDIRGASYFIRDEVPRDAKVVSCERIKTVFWSERSMGKYDRANLKPDTYVMLQNLYCDLEWEMNYLKEKYNTEVVYRKAGTVMPILADEMYLRQVKRKDGTMGFRGSSNRPISLRTQFSKHRFESVVVLIKQ